MTRMLLCLALVLASGCPQPMDPGVEDAPAMVDAGVDSPANDVPMTPDALDDDADDDGIVASRDCDDMHPAVGTSGSRSCDGPCGPGVAACIDGAWQACMASTECLCPTNGMTRTMPCGTMCGVRTDTCVELHWVAGATCDSEGVCESDAAEMVNGPRCSVSRRVCGDDCSWGSATPVAPEGVCERGQVSCIARQRCTDLCVWEVFTSDPTCP
jgi:hypothetical protein